MPQFSPTAEQEAVVQAFRTNEDIKIEAGAGTGKTSTLVLLAEDLYQRAATKKVAYIAYNKAIQVDASARFPENTDCRTAHSHAYRAIIARNRSYQQRLKSRRTPAWQIAQTLNITADKTFGHGDEARTLKPVNQARLALATVTRFCQSDKFEVEGWMVPKQDGLENEHAQIVAHILPYARRAWDDLRQEHGKLKFDHQHYLKLYQLSKPKINANVILYDEAQDANPVIADIVQRQADHAQIVMVGDSAQAIYGWNGAIDAMQRFQANHHLYLTKSFRFGQAIADEANKFLDRLDTPLRLEGFEKIASRVDQVDDPDAVLCRTNGGVVEVAMKEYEHGKKVAVVGGMAHIKQFADAADDLMAGTGTDHPDLAAFQNWNEVVEYSKEDEGADLRVLVRLVETYGTQALREVANNCADEKYTPDADIIVSTAHKAKGREWNRVRIHSDFSPPKEGGDPAKPELMLMYVSVTRAKQDLDALALVWVFDPAAQEDGLAA